VSARALAAVHRAMLACISLGALAGPCSADANDAGTLTVVGSDTLSTLVLRWNALFRAHHPGVTMQLQTPGSASAPIALLEGAADIGAMSRPMNDREDDAFRARYGYAPTGVVVAHDAIAVFVHPDNPLTSITRKQLDAIYSDSRRCGAPATIVDWNALGATSGAKAGHILANGRNEASGTSEFFRERALCGGAYKAEIVVWPGHGATVAAVAGNREAIGYAGIGYLNGLVKPLAVAGDDDAPAIAPVVENVMNGHYALARALRLYMNRAPAHAASLPSDFLAFVLSREAQAIVAEEGFLPLSPDEAAVQLRSIAPNTVSP
jgi:phosphate transport system substrate-binding protein